MAANDIFLWSEQASESLPNGSVSITRSTSTPPEYTITINWDEPGSSESYTVTIPVAGSS